MTDRMTASLPPMVHIKKHSSENVSPTPFIQLTLAATEVHALVDTGSGLSLISDECRRSIPSLTSQPLCKSFTLASSVTGHFLDILGTISAPVHIGDITLPHVFHVVRAASHPVILGWDFLTKHQATVNLPQATVQLYNTEVPFSQPQSLIPVQVAAVTISAVTVPPMSEMAIPISVLGSMALATPSDPYVGLLEPHVSPTTNLALARTLTAIENGKGIIRVVNPTHDPVLLDGGCPVGQVFAVMGRPHDEYALVSSVTVKDNPGDPTPVVSVGDACTSSEQQSQLKQLILEFADIFSAHAHDYGQTTLVKHKINTGDAEPIKLRPYRASPATQAILQQEVSKLLKHGVVEESCSPWSAPVVLVKKKDGTHRFCVDFRRLNSVTIKDSHPLPRVDDTLDRLAGANIFSTIDLTAGYWQIPLNPADKEKTAFSTGAGLYQFRMMPMGLSNAPPSFQRLMELVLRGLHWSVCLIYLDDIILYSQDFPQHLQHLKEVFQRFRSAGLKLKPSKCHLACSSVTFLGHRVSSNGVEPDPANTEKVANWPVPQSATQVRAFLGLCSYYRRFIQDFAHIADPLHRLTHKGVPFIWSGEAEEAFSILKQALTSPPVMAFPDLSAPFLLYTDASLHAIGSVLSQGVNGQEHVIAYASHLLSASERKWSTFDRELWAIVWGVRHFRHYLAAHPFTIITDHKPLVGLKKLPLDQDPTGRRARWSVELDLYDWHIVHRDGAKHLNADAMSRCPPSDLTENHSPAQLTEAADMATQTENTTETSSNAVPIHHGQIQNRTEHQLDLDLATGTGSTTQGMPINHVQIQTEWNIAQQQQADPDLATVWSWVTTGRRPPVWRLRGASAYLKKMWSQFSRLTITNGILVRSTLSPPGIEQVVIPTSLIPDVLHHVHGHPGAGHYSFAKSLDKAQRKFYWPYMSTDVSKHCTQCLACQSRRSPVPRPQAPLVSISPERPFQIVAADITELPMSTKGHRYVLVMMDLYTKFVNLYPLKDQTAVSVAHCIFEKYVPQHGVPESLHSDQGRQFESDLVKQLCTLLSIHKLRTSPYHAQCDGAVERYNRTLKEELAKYLLSVGQEWDDHLPQIALAYNTTTHTSTGFTPFFLAHGREARIPLDNLLTPELNPTLATGGTPAAYAHHLRKRLSSAYESATGFRDKAQEQQRHYYDRHQKYSPYQAGDLILVDDPAHQRNKIAPRWIGPYQVIQPLAPSDSSPPVTFLIRDLSRPDAKSKVIHYNRTKPFISDPSQPMRHLTPFNRHVAPPATLSGFLPCHNLPSTPTFHQQPIIHSLAPQHPNQTHTDGPTLGAGPSLVTGPRPSADPLPQVNTPGATLGSRPSAGPPPQVTTPGATPDPGSAADSLTQVNPPVVIRSLPGRVRRLPSYLMDFELS